MRRFRSEFEELGIPAWKRILDEINRSKALFLLVGKELVKAQAVSESDWKYTQNWIAYEIGLACKSNIDVWVITDSIDINFPVPYLNNYDIHGFDPKMPHQRKWMYQLLESYKRGMKYRLGWNTDFLFECPYDTCGAEYNFYSQLEKGTILSCPTCLRQMEFKEGRLL